MWSRCVRPQHGVNDQHNYRGRCHNHGIHAEFIFHVAALCLSGYDGGIGDEREVVAEIGASHNHCHHEGRGETDGVGDARRYGH